MARDPRHDILFEPVAIGPKVLRNRFYQVPHCSGFGTDKPGTQARHRAVKAEGGWAAVCTEYAPISPDSDGSPYSGATIWDADDAEILSLMVDEAHAHGSLAGIELHHAGVHGERRGSRLPALGPSQAMSDMVPFNSPDVPKEMELGDIRRVQQDWVAAAGRDCAVAVRIAANAMGPGGVELDETLAFVRMADELVDLWDVNLGSIVEWQQDSGVSRFFPEGYQLEWTGSVRRATAKAIVGVGRLTDPDRMADIVRSGAWDLIGAARPSIADPFLPVEIAGGGWTTSASAWASTSASPGRSGATTSAAPRTPPPGGEYRRAWHPERSTRATNAELDVLVVGAGPAGLECATVLGKRGMSHVHLVEADREVGGHLRWAPRPPGPGEWARFVNHRRIQLDKLRNVEVITGVRLSAEEIATYGAELVVPATGSRWAGDGLSGVSHEPLPGADASQPWVLTPEQVVVEGKRPPGRRFAVYDTDGYYVAAGVAELLAGEGYEVRLVTPFDVVAPYTDETLEGPMLRRHLHDVGVAVARTVTLTSVGPGAVLGCGEFDEELELPADGVVLVTQRRSDDALYRELAAQPDRLAADGVIGLYRIGDCVAPACCPTPSSTGTARAARSTAPTPPAPALHPRARPAAHPRRAGRRVAASRVTGGAGGTAGTGG